MSTLTPVIKNNTQTKSTALSSEIGEASQNIEQHRSQYYQRVKDIKANETLSDKGKAEQIDELYDMAAKKHKELVQERDKAVQSYADKRKRRLFSLNDSSVSDQLAYDEAVATFSSLSKDDMLQRLETGSKATQKAIFKAAYQNGRDKVFDRYVQLNPDSHSDAQQLVRWDERYGRNQSTTAKMNVNMANRFPKEP